MRFIIKNGIVIEVLFFNNVFYIEKGGTPSVNDIEFISYDGSIKRFYFATSIQDKLETIRKRSFSDTKYKITYKSSIVIRFIENIIDGWVNGINNSIIIDSCHSLKTHTVR
jgi:hypothetical protein